MSKTAVRLGSLALTAPLALGLTACSTMVEEKSLESELAQKLSASSVDCPGDLEGKAGAELICTVSKAGENADYKVRVTGRDGSKVQFEATPVDGATPAEPNTEPTDTEPTVTEPTDTDTTDTDTPEPTDPDPTSSDSASSGDHGTPTVARRAVENEISSQLTAKVGRTPDLVTCPGDLTGVTGETMRCSLAAGGQTIGVTVTVTDVVGSRVNFNIKVDDRATS